MSHSVNTRPGCDRDTHHEDGAGPRHWPWSHGPDAAMAASPSITKPVAPSSLTAPARPQPMHHVEPTMVKPVRVRRSRALIHAVLLVAVTPAVHNLRLLLGRQGPGWGATGNSFDARLRWTVVVEEASNWTLPGPVTAAQALQLPIRRARVVRFADPLVVSDSTVVAGYFLTESKYSSDVYASWMVNFLSTRDPMVIFTEAALVGTVRDLRRHALNATVVIETTLQDLPITQVHPAGYASVDRFWRHELEVDPERRIHRSHRLFQIWLSKTWWVTQAIRYNFFHSEFFMYSDVGCYRNRRYNGRTVVLHPELVPPGAVLWMAHHPIDPPPVPLWNRKLDPHERRHFFHSGSQGAGTAAAWVLFHVAFVQTLDAFLVRGMFIGEDQVVLQSACLQMPQLCAYVPADQVKDNHYFGLRHVLHHGGTYEFWRPPPRQD